MLRQQLSKVSVIASSDSRYGTITGPRDDVHTPLPAPAQAASAESHVQTQEIPNSPSWQRDDWRRKCSPLSTFVSASHNIAVLLYAKLAGTAGMAR
jgi:hypothetical protein